MADVFIDIVESPLTSGKLITAMTAAMAAVATSSGVPIMASFNQGRSMAVGFIDGDSV